MDQRIIEWISTAIMAILANTGVAAAIWWHLQKKVLSRVRDIEHEKAVGMSQCAMIVSLEGDEFGRIVFITPICAAEFGYTHDELIGKPLAWLIPGDLQKIHEDHLKSFAMVPRRRGMGGTEQRIVGVHRNGIEIPVVVSLTPCVIGDNLKCVASILTMARISQLKTQIDSAEKKLKQAEGQK